MSKLKLITSSSARHLVFASLALVLTSILVANAPTLAAGWDQVTTERKTSIEDKDFIEIPVHLSAKNHGRIVSIQKLTLDLSTLSQAAFGDRE